LCGDFDSFGMIVTDWNKLAICNVVPKSDVYEVGGLMLFRNALANSCSLTSGNTTFLKRFGEPYL